MKVPRVLICNQNSSYGIEVCTHVCESKREPAGASRGQQEPAGASRGRKRDGRRRWINKQTNKATQRHRKRQTEQEETEQEEEEKKEI